MKEGMPTISYSKYNKQKSIEEIQSLSINCQYLFFIAYFFSSRSLAHGKRDNCYSHREQF